MPSFDPDPLILLKGLVEINSYTFNRQGVCQVGDRFEALFSSLGFQSRRVPSVNPLCGDHLFFSKPGKKGQRILLVGHMDTVFPAEQELSEGHVWREVGDKIYGPGTADMKGGVVVIYSVLRTLREEHSALFDDLGFEVLLNASEETSCTDFPELARAVAGTNSTACLVYEAGMASKGAGICTTRKGSARFKLEVQGRAAHSGEDYARGASAVRELARLIEKIEAMGDPTRGLTCNVGIAGGGRVINGVPDQAFCNIDLRATDAKGYADGSAMILALAGPGSISSPVDGFKTQISVKAEVGFPPWSANDAGEKLALHFQAAAKDLGLDLPLRQAGASSDGNFLWDLAPTIDELGPLGGNLHCASKRDGMEPEYALRSSFAPRIQLSVDAIRRLARP